MSSPPMRRTVARGLAAGLLAICALLSASALRAEEAPPLAPKVLGVWGSRGVGGLPLLEDGESLWFEIDQLPGLVSRAKKGNALTLFVAEVPLEGCRAQLVPGHPNRVRFDLSWTEESRAAWTRVLGRVSGGRHTVTAAVGLADSSVVAAGDARLIVQVVRWRLRWILITLVLAAIGVLLWRTKLNRLLRTPGGGEQSKLPFSLGRVQMAWWFFNILIAYLLIWATVGALDTITPQMLVLMGIGAGTALGATVIDANKLSLAKEAVAAAERELAAAPQNPEKQLALDEAKAELKERDAATMSASGGFLNDILSDNSGYSLHRFQMAGWTLVVTTIFWYSVWRDLAMPQLGDTLLALMGISSGTYLGFKFPEK